MIPLVEIVPSPYTDSSVVEKTKQLMEKVGNKPVRKFYYEGFFFWENLPEKDVQFVIIFFGYQLCFLTFF